MDEAIKATKNRIEELREESEYSERQTELEDMLDMFESMRENMVLTRNEARKVDGMDRGTVLLDRDLVYWIKGHNEWFSNIGTEHESAVDIFDTTGIKWIAYKPTEEESGS